MSSISGAGLVEKLNQWSGKQSGGSKYGTKRHEISTEAEKVDARPEAAETAQSQ